MPTPVRETELNPSRSLQEAKDTGVQRGRSPLLGGLRMRKIARHDNEFRAFSGALFGIALGSAMWALVALGLIAAW
jgi:hypothetical protein